jgi:hypothetical protein
MNLLRLAFTVVVMLVVHPACAIGTAFTYQGHLEDGGQPASGTYDFQFRVFSPSAAQFGSTLLADNVQVTAGSFTVQLDFGAGVFTGFDRLLDIGVRPGASTGAYTQLLPRTPLTAAPYAQLATDAQAADIAADVTDNAIDEIDVNTGAISSRNLANNSISIDKLQSNSVSIAKLLGANYTSPANLTANIGASSCSQFDIPVAGGFEVGDFVIAMPNSTFPSNVIISVGVVVSANVVRLRFCNVGNAAQSMSNEQIRLISLR